MFKFCIDTEMHRWSSFYRKRSSAALQDFCGAYTVDGAYTGLLLFLLLVRAVNVDRKDHFSLFCSSETRVRVEELNPMLNFQRPRVFYIFSLQEVD